MCWFALDYAPALIQNTFALKAAMCHSRLDIQMCTILTSTRCFSFKIGEITKFHLGYVAPLLSALKFAQALRCIKQGMLCYLINVKLLN